MGVVERSRRYYSVPLEVPFLSGGQLSAARGGLRLIQAPRLLVDFAKSSGARSDLAVLARAGVASVVPGRAGDGAGAKAGNFHRGEDRPGSGCRSRRQFSCHRKQHRGRPQRADRYAHAQRYDDAELVVPPDGRVIYEHLGPAVDRFEGNTKGKVAVFGLLETAGVPLDVSVGNPLLVFAQKANAFLDFDGTAIPAYSEPEDVPSWWKSEAVGGETNDV